MLTTRYLLLEGSVQHSSITSLTSQSPIDLSPVPGARPGTRHAPCHSILHFYSEVLSPHTFVTFQPSPCSAPAIEARRQRSESTSAAFDSVKAFAARSVHLGQMIHTNCPTLSLHYPRQFLWRRALNYSTVTLLAT